MFVLVENKNGNLKRKFQHDYEIALMLTVVFMVVSLRGSLLFWKKSKLEVGVEELKKGKEELAKMLDKLQLVLQGKNGQAAQDMVFDKSFRLFWEEMRKEKGVDSKEELERKGSVMGLFVLMFGGIILVGSLRLFWKFLYKCSKKTSDSVQ